MAAPRCLELFAGAGGAALGLGAAGLEHAALCEWDRHACATLRAAGLGPVVEGDVRALDAIAAVAGERVDVLWSSFPCQAWSIIGERLGARDERNGWPWTMAAVDRFRPAWFLGENVRGLLIHREGCSAAGGQQGLFGLAPAEDCPGCYLERVIMPDLRRRFAFAGWWLLNAADFGVPQRRYRVILWAGPALLTAPVPTHGPGRARPWVTMREALGVETRSFGTDPSEAETVYARRVRNLSDRPSPTVGAMYRGWLGGQPWAQLPDGQRRILTVEECALLQGFPAGHPWQGQSRPQYRQVGNAVPPRLAEVVGRALMGAIEDVRGLS
jgi:DNA (cytosine-5)-methyltransferase 1